jgi:DNA-binding NarL/FixJ family response regulator
VQNQRELELASVLIADDHFAVLESVVPMLKPFFNVVGTASDGKAAVEAEDRLHPDVVILDISMPVMSGIDAAKQMRKQGSKAQLYFSPCMKTRIFLPQQRPRGARAMSLSRAWELI